GWELFEKGCTGSGVSAVFGWGAKVWGPHAGKCGYDAGIGKNWHILLTAILFLEFLPSLLVAHVVGIEHTAWLVGEPVDRFVRADVPQVKEALVAKRPHLPGRRQLERGFVPGQGLAIGRQPLAV